MAMWKPSRLARQDENAHTYTGPCVLHIHLVHRNLILRRPDLGEEELQCFHVLSPITSVRPKQSNTNKCQRYEGQNKLPHSKYLYDNRAGL